MSQNLIPFGLQPDSGRLLSVFDVNNGRDCGCVCPSCGQGMLARQGDKNTWSFAHDKDSPIMAKKACELSFDTVCRHYLYQYIARRSKPMKWLLPPRLGRDQPKGITLALMHGSAGFDFEARFEKYTLYLLIDYCGRQQTVPAVAANEAVLILDIAGIKQRYLESGGKEVSLDAEIERLIVGDLKHKRWHALPQTPAQQLQAQRLQERLAQEQRQQEQQASVVPAATEVQETRYPYRVGALTERVAIADQQRKNGRGRQVPRRQVSCNECGVTFYSEQAMMGKGLKCDDCKRRPHNQPLQLTPNREP